MALLMKKLSFLPFVVAKVPGCNVESYFLARSFATRRTTNKVPAIVVDDAENETSTDEDEITSDSMEVVEFDKAAQIVDGTNDEFDIPCRVAMPKFRRWWAYTQDESALRFRMDMPGVAREDVKVYVDNTKLVVRGKYAGKKVFAGLEDDKANSIHDNEGVYSAELVLPENVHVDKIKSQMKEGVLLVTAPKKVTNVLVE